MATDLTGGIRRAAEPPRRPGHTAPSTAGINQGSPTLAAQPPATQPSGGNARAFGREVHRHEDRGWHELHAVEHRAYMETVVAVTVADGETLVLDPTRAQVWRVAVTGAATISLVPAPEFPEAATPRQDAPERMRTWSLVLLLEVPPGGDLPAFTGVKWPGGTAAPQLTDDGLPPSGGWGGRYTFTLVHDPVAGDVLGHPGGIRF